MGDAQDTFEAAVELQLAGRLAEAVEIYRRLAGQRLTVNTALNLGTALADLGELEEAGRWLGLAARNRAGDPGVRLQLANVYAGLGKVDQAELEYRTALALQPDFPRAKLALSGLLLSVGRYAEGWPLMRERIALNPDVVPPVTVPYPEWRGEPLAGRSILVWYEQGLGDQIQMARFARSLKDRGAAQVTLGCRPPLVDLLAQASGVDQVIRVAQGGRINVPRHDLWTRYFSLPEALGVTLETLPAAPYLSPPADRRARWPGFQGKIGLAWQASSTGFNAANKNLTPAEAKVLLDLGCVCLHPEDTGASDFADTAAIVEQLDLVISIDTSVAHLAGAMGKPCWTMLPYLGLDWRWLRGRADSPWYPSMRLYRQTRARDWTGVLAAVVRDLKALRTQPGAAP